MIDVIKEENLEKLMGAEIIEVYYTTDLDSQDKYGAVFIFTNGKRVEIKIKIEE